MECLRRFIAEGADLVAMSGGKAFRGPQSSAFLCGRRDLVASALLQQVDMDVAPASWTPPKEFVQKPLNGVPRHGFGRGFKVGKEEIAGAVAALETFTSKETDYQKQWADRCRGFAAALAGLAGVEAIIVPRETTGRLPLVELVFPSVAKAAEVSRGLRDGVPSIHLNERRVGEGRLTFNPVGLDDGPQLAERWTTSADGKTYTFHLRKGVKFHDGSPVTAADVVASVERFRAQSPRKADLSMVAGARAVDNGTVEITLSQPSAAFVPLMAYPGPAVAIMPKKLIEGVPAGKLPQSPGLGTG